MGILPKGRPLKWRDTKYLANYVRAHGIEQFIQHYLQFDSHQKDPLKWGDEIEYMLVHFDHDTRKVKVSLRGADILSILNSNDNSEDLCNNEVDWAPEYAAFMIESCPGTPNDSQLACFNTVENNLKLRRRIVTELLKPGEALMTVSSFPRLGCGDFTIPSTGSFRSSSPFPDECVNPAHPKYLALTKNIKKRRGSKVGVNVPIFRDKETPEPFIYDAAATSDSEIHDNSKPNHICLDEMGFGLSCCCLQVTLQSVNESEARWLYDQLSVLTPIMVALSAATPIFRGYLTDIDSRWNIISTLIDDRTPAELGLKSENEEGAFRIHKSRYSTRESYLHPWSAAYNDIDMVYDHDLYQKMRESGIDELLAKHVSHVFIHDPLVLYSGHVEVDDSETMEHFENVYFTTWPNVHLKLPSPEDSMGWRVEFRPTELQLTDTENLAYMVFIILLTRMLISYRISLLIPISKVHENMNRAQRRDAVLNEKFYFRGDVATCSVAPETALDVCSADGEPLKIDSRENQKGMCAHYKEMTINEIMNGQSDGGFPGLIPLIHNYLDDIDVDVETRSTIQKSLQLIGSRASGETFTVAHWIRDFVRSHREYKFDSYVSEVITYDLMLLINKLATGQQQCSKLLGVEDEVIIGRKNG